ncbi:helix-turn-helix transcriptional regulator [Flavobacterium sp. ST-75]|uniref:Helix-turn-helix transcriptional regulator n=1 Tax=Flavobacterium rhizophilum TaxID=3163296 RepID=A0ABW8Y8Y9_9FLAO
MEKDYRFANVTLPHPNSLLVIEPLDYSNPYDFQRPHRHDYFEIICVEGGQGTQYIDFKKFDLAGGQVYNIYPGQVHLMHRGSAYGVLIQFRKDLFEFIKPITHDQLYFNNPAFTPDQSTFNRLYDIAGQIKDLLLQEELTTISKYKAYSYLQIVLLTLVEMKDKDSLTINNSQLVSLLLSLLSENIYSCRKVADYCELMNCSQDKLNTACKNALGKTVLELIHEELLLEIRRLFLLSPLSLKEIAYELNFDSPANFSAFIKSHTGLTPTELQASILEIYK